MAEIRIIKAHQREVEVASGSMTRLAGVSATLVGAQGIHLAIATIPPECSSSAHWHTNCESAIYITRGHGRFLVGEDLGTGDVNGRATENDEVVQKLGTGSLHVYV